MRTLTQAFLCSTLLATVALSVSMAQEAPSTEASYKLSGEASVSSLAYWIDDGAFEAADVRYGSDAALTLSLDARRRNIRASFSGRADIMTGISALPPAGPESFMIKRAYLRWMPGHVVITAGRQVINWGAAMLWSPADLFAETLLAGLSTERQGTDAIRIGMPLGTLGGVEAVGIPGSSFSTGRYGGRLYGYALGSDMGLQLARDLALGTTTLAVNIKTDMIVGVWAEAAYTMLDDEGCKDRIETVIGADWSVGYKTIVSAEYRYNVAGASDAASAISASAQGEAFPAIHYLFANIGTKLGDFVSLGVGAVIDLGNGIASSSVTAAIDVAQDASLTLLAQYANGDFRNLIFANSATIGATLSLAF